MLIRRCLVGAVLLFAFFRLNPYLSTEHHPPRVRFVDVAETAGLTSKNFNGGDKQKSYIIESTGSGIAFFDYNNDGFSDVLMVNGTTFGHPLEERPTNHLFKNNQDGTFRDVTVETGLGRSGWGQGVCIGDYDNDNWIDVFITYYGTNILYHGNFGKSFTDVTAEAGLKTSGGLIWATGCAFVDYDRDGLLDLFVASYVKLDLEDTPSPGSFSFCRWKGVPVFCGPKGLPLSRNYVYRNNGDGTFVDVSETAGIRKGNRGYAFSVLTADFRNSGWPDIYVACDSTPSLLYQNNGNGTFSEIGVLSGVAYSNTGIAQAGMGVAAGDYDVDGFVDIFKTNFTDDVSNLYRNNGDGTFNDMIFEAGAGQNYKFLGWGTAFFDYDNDGWSDLIVANGHVYPESELEARYPDEPYRMRKIVYHNRRNGTFEDVSLKSGPGILIKKSSRGLAIADFDNDGDVDVVVNNQNDFPTLLRNDGGNQRHWVEINAIGTNSNRAAIGTQVRVVTGNHSQSQEVRSGGSYLSQNDLRLHFGLDEDSQIDLLELRWPSGAIDRIERLPVNRIYTVKEGSGVIQVDMGLIGP